jgi:Glycosyl-hydrolase family 116, catalytic region
VNSFASEEEVKVKDKRISIELLNKFIEYTQIEVDKGVNPGGHYKAVWARDAAFILRDQFLSGHFKIVLQQILLIWSNQILATTKDEKLLSLLSCDLKTKPLLYGRGSPEMNFNPVIADGYIKKKFEGALPTTIYYEKNFCEVYGQNPDIDSTALMISTTSYILSNLLVLKDNSQILNYEQVEPEITLSLKENIDNKRRREENEIIPFSKFSLNDIINFLIPRMLNAIKYLQNRDIDDDGLLEQKHNEDWMDTTLRIGKVVYSQACWILALKNLSVLVKKLGNQMEAKKLDEMVNRAIVAVEDKMWSVKDRCYIDLLDADWHLDEKMHNRLVTQDISLYLVALTEDNKDSNYKNIDNENIDKYPEKSENYINNRNSDRYQRALSTLEVLKERAWKNNLPLVTETEITKTGPWLLETNEYHNHTCWPWITGIEMLARTRFGKIDDCNILLSKFVSSEGVDQNMLYEWVNPLTFQGSGAYPFRTGISSIRIALIESLT